MKFNPRVSIVIPVYNGSNYIREAIDSALAQTYKNLEIIVVNDGSKDNTEEIVKSYGDKVRYFSKPNGGTSTALNIGVKNMTGDYFSWLSHDDQYYPNKIERQVEELSKLKNKNTIMMTDLDGIDENYEKIYQTNYIEHIKKYPPREKSYLHPIIYNQTHGCTLLIPKICFDTVGLFDEQQRVAEDFEFFYRAFQKFPHKLIPEVLVTARDTSKRKGRTLMFSSGYEEYSNLFINIIENFSEEDYKLLAPTKLNFYYDMKAFFSSVGYGKAYNYICKKAMTNLQISSYDLIGNKFNGYDMHLFLIDKDIDSRQLVQYKLSQDPTTYVYNFDRKDATKELILKKIFIESELIHLHLVHNLMDLNYLPLMSRLKPTIITLHDPFFLGGHCVHHFDCSKWQKHCYDCEYLDCEFRLDRDYSSLNYQLKKQAIQNSNISAIVASKWMENKVKESPIWKGKKIYYLPFGINQSIFKPADKKEVRKNLNIPEDDFVIMFRADKGKFKGFDIIKKALDSINKKLKVTLITVCDKDLLNEYKNRYNIVEYGWITDDNLLSQLYQACDIFLMPSRQETFGMMAIEAMSCGKMVLGLDCDSSAISDVINSPECSLAVKEEDYVKELNKLLKNTSEIETRGKKSLEFARKNYSKEVFTNRMIDIYNDVINNHVIDEEAQLVLDQLKKYSVPDQIVDGVVNNVSTPVYEPILRRIYRKLPLKLRKKIKDVLRPIYHKIKKMI